MRGPEVPGGAGAEKVRSVVPGGAGPEKILRDATIRLSRPVLGRDEAQALFAVLSGGNLVQGPWVRAFEEKIAARLGVPHAVAVSSGTAALHLALRALGVGPGDEVIVPAFTFPATANVVAWLGARPVFCDIDLKDFAATPESFAGAVTRRTRAVMPVHPFGQPADVPAIRAAVTRAARGQRPSLVEDAACALGSSLGNRPAGTMGDAGCFSFHPRKILTTGEGGLIVTARRGLAERVGALRTHGMVRTGGGFRMSAPGLNYRMNDLQGALGLAQLERLDTNLAERARLAAIYRQALSGCADVTLPPERPDRIAAVQSFVVLLRMRALRARLEAALRRAGIETTFGTHCVPMLGWYRRTFGYTPKSFPKAWSARQRSLTLPLYPGLDAASQGRVIAVLEEVLA